MLLNAAAFGIPPPFTPGTNGVPPCDASGCDYYETGYASGGRNIFRSPFQSRWDFGIFKQFQITERFGLRFDAQAFNVFNHPSFDVPSNDVEFNPFFSNPPTYTPGTTGLTPCVGPPAQCICLSAFRQIRGWSSIRLAVRGSCSSLCTLHSKCVTSKQVDDRRLGSASCVIDEGRPLRKPPYRRRLQTDPSLLLPKGSGSERRGKRTGIKLGQATFRKRNANKSPLLMSKIVKD